MACTQHSNTPNGEPCTGHVAPSPLTDWVDPVPTQIDISAEQFNQLKSAIDAQLSKRATSYVVPTKNPEDIIEAEDWKALRNAINACSPWTFPSEVDNSALAVGVDIQAQTLVTLRNQTNVLEADCVCDCNYTCTCDCNYCTCDCNYCTCDCNYCTCNCNYSCTCNCNYSDIRLKTDIELI